MSVLDVTMACVPTDRSRPILDGSLAIPGMRITALPGEPEEIFRRALREEAFDITEMSMSSHITVPARGASAYVAVPVFPSRAFRHSGIFIRTDRGINVPADLKGKRIGIPEYQQTDPVAPRHAARRAWHRRAGHRVAHRRRQRAAAR
jgi:4,5-dihydroxyphthalate decarboxylase